MSEVSGAYEDGARTLPRDAPARRGSPPPTAISQSPVGASLPVTARRRRRLAAGPHPERETPLERLAGVLTATPTLAALLALLLLLLAVLV